MDIFIGFNDGAKGIIARYMDRFYVLELAQKTELKSLDTVCVDKGVIFDDISYPVTTKSIPPVVGGWKSNLHICRNSKDLMVAHVKY